MEIKKGKDLSKETIKILNQIVQKAFPGNEPVEKGKEDLFFIHKEKDKILAMGRLRPMKINFLKKTYNILGVADIVAVVKKKGHGKKLMRAMFAYLKKNGKTGVGFCSRKNSIFYLKCGYHIAKDQVRRFLWKNWKPKDDDDVLYINGKDKFMDVVLNHPNEIVELPMRHW